MPGKWLVYVEADRLNGTARSEDFNCWAHSFPLDFRQGFPASVRSTLPNVLERVEDVDVPTPPGRASGARGVITIRGEDLKSRLKIASGFLSANVVTDVDITASVTVDRPGGRLFGKTFDGHGRADRPVGMFCAGGAEALRAAAEDAQRDVLRRIAEEIANTERLRSGRSS